MAQGQRRGSILEERVTVAKFLLRRLNEAGVDHIFGVPGDFCLGFFNEIIKHEKIKYVGTCNELNAAYAADAYARVKGIGCLSTTYCVGELSAINGVAGCYAENVPIVKITGCPASQHYTKGTLLHHTLGDYNAPKLMYDHITVKSVLLNNPETAASQIDEVLYACLEHKKPVYIGICSDIVMAECTAPKKPFEKPKLPSSDPAALQEAVLETMKILHSSRSPILIPGVEIRRFGLCDLFRELVDKSGLPYATMMLGKCTLNEDHPQFIGLYCGDRSRDYVRERVEKSDCVLVFGEKMTDFNTGGFTAVLDFRTVINVSRDNVRISYHQYPDVYIHDFMREITKMIVYRKPDTLNIKEATLGCVHTRYRDFKTDEKKDLTMARLFDRFARFIPKNSIVIAETGASLFSAAEVLMPEGVHFIGQTFYGSIGYTVGACLGACIAAPNTNVILFIGDGSFQVTAQDLSTMIRYNCKPLIVLVNNDGYTIERVIVDHPYNDIQPWKYTMLTDVFGGGKSFQAKTEGELDNALSEIESMNRSELCFLEVFLDRWDCNDALRKAGETMARNNKLIDTETLIKRKSSSAVV